MSKSNPEQLFPVKHENGLMTTAEAAVARAAQEVQAAMVIAKRFPRNETEAFNRILTACKRKSLAECAVYSYPRGGTAVTGPSIRLAECLAQNWGNMDFGVVELDQRNGESQVMAYAWDLETNTRQTKIFTVKHERRVGKGENFRIDALTDPRDIYEMVANNGARRLRACILGVIPGDVVDAAVEQCDKTVEDKDAKTPLIDKVRKLPSFFDRYGVTQAMLETKLGHKLDDTTSREYSELLKVYNALKDNVGKVADFFPPEPTKPDLAKAETKFTDEGEGTDLGPQKAQGRGDAPLVPPALAAQIERGHTAAAQSEPERKVQSVAQEPPPAPAPEDKDATVRRMVKALKGLLQISSYTEIELLNFLHSKRGISEDIGTLAALGKEQPDVVAALHDNWRVIEGEFSAWKKAAK